MIKLAALAAGLNSEPQPATSSAESNIEYRRMVSLRSFLFKIDNAIYAGSMAERGLRVKAARSTLIHH
jgi:hypothetical protein